MLILAVIPSVVLFYVIWRCDRKEKEPPKLLLKLFLFGALAVIPIVFLELFFDRYIEELLSDSTYVFLFVDNFIGTALIEEGVKYFILKKSTWKHPAFNYSFDAVVYAVAVSLGYATIENIVFLAGESMSTAIFRAIFSIPGHVIYAIFMGCYYGRAKLEPERKKRNLRLALFVPSMLHGFYDFCIETEEDIFIWIFLAFEVVVVIAAIRKVRQLSREDRAISGEAQKSE